MQIFRFFPSYYIAEGVINASPNAGTVGANLFDVGISPMSTLVLLAISAWVLRRQSSVLALV